MLFVFNIKAVNSVFFIIFNFIQYSIKIEFKSNIQNLNISFPISHRAFCIMCSKLLRIDNKKLRCFQKQKTLLTAKSFYYEHMMIKVFCGFYSKKESKSHVYYRWPYFCMNRIFIKQDMHSIQTNQNYMIIFCNNPFI